MHPAPLPPRCSWMRMFMSWLHSREACGRVGPADRDPVDPARSLSHPFLGTLSHVVDRVPTYLLHSLLSATTLKGTPRWLTLILTGPSPSTASHVSASCALRRGRVMTTPTLVSTPRMASASGAPLLVDAVRLVRSVRLRSTLLLLLRVVVSRLFVSCGRWVILVLSLALFLAERIL